MGCTGSKSTDVKSQSESNGTYTSSTSRNAARKGPSGEWITEGEAVDMVMELGVSETRAKKLVESVPRNDKGLINGSESSVLRDKMLQLRDEMCPEFAEYDKDNSGFVTIDEATAILKKKMPKLSDDTIKVMISRYDENRDGRFDINEFIYFSCCIYARKDYLESMFNEMDSDKSGYLDPEAVSAAIVEQFEISAEFAQNLVTVFDRDEDGRIDKQEFFNVMNTITFE